jgi:hypothetical protein
MTVTVLDSADLVEATTTGVIPVPRGIAEDNASQKAKHEAKEPVEPKSRTVVESNKPEVKTETRDKSYAGAAATKDEFAAMDNADDPDNVPGEDGLTARQKRIYTKQMQGTIAKNFAARKEAEQFATSEYNQRQLAEQRAETLARENAEMKAKLTPASKVDELKEPQRADFKEDQAYWDAMVDFRVDKKLKIARAEQVQRDEEARQAEVIGRARAKVERAIELVEDYKEVTEAVDTPVPPFVAGAMQESDLLAELGYHFAKYPEVLERLGKITEGIAENTPAFRKAVTRQLLELGKIESTLQPFAPKAKVQDEPNVVETSPPTATRAEPQTGTAPSKPRVQAPIIQPLNGGSAQVEKDEADMTGSQVITSWQKKHGVVLTARKRH